MLTENDVVSAMVKYFENSGYTVEQALSTKQKGIDIIAKSSKGVNYYIEAKGGTSARKNSNRYSRPFTKAQVRTHISVAIYKCFEILEKKIKAKNVIGIAVPKDKNHTSCLNAIRKPLKSAGIQVYLVDQDYNVEMF